MTGELLPEECAAMKKPVITIPRMALNILVVSLALRAAPLRADESVFVNAVVASVDGTPITMQDLNKRLSPPRQISLKEASNDTEARQVLDSIIMELLIKQEAESRKISATEEEVNQYLDEVAKRNNITVDTLPTALAAENKDFASYKKQVEVDILRSKLASNHMKGGVSVSHQEIEAYLGDHPELAQKGSRVLLRQIFVSGSAHTAEEAREKIDTARKRLADGEDFTEVAASLSEGPEAAEGGKLDSLAESDMHPNIFNAVLPLKEGEFTEIVETPAGLHIFKLEERLNAEDKDARKALEEEVSKTIKQQKMQDRMNTYFTQELFKLHSVDKKI
jgi:peptidyl-prolyl cis-trans isomerase SurA